MIVDASAITVNHPKVQDPSLNKKILFDNEAPGNLF